MDVKGRDLVSGIPQNISITSEEVRKAISEPVDSIVQGRAHRPGTDSSRAGPRISWTAASF